MTEWIAVNWLVIGLEITIGVVWSSVFFNEFFPFLELPKVRYQFNQKYNLIIKKSWRSFVGQFIKFIFNLLLVVILAILSLILSDQEIPFVGSQLDSLVSKIPAMNYFIPIGLIILLLPRFLVRIVLSPYWIRQLKYFVLLGFIFLPLFLLDGPTIGNYNEFHSIYPDYSVWINLILPTQLLEENGYALTQVEKMQLFLLVFLIIPLAISLLYQILPRLFRRYQKYGIFEWKEDSWQSIDDHAYERDDDTAVLLLHGLGSNKEMWSGYSREKGSERIMDYLSMTTDERYLHTKIFAIDFSDRLKDTFSTKYRIGGRDLFGTDVKTGLNNYVWEVIFAIQLLVEVKEIERLHIIAHSSGGVIVRQVLSELYTNEELQTVRDRLGYQEDKHSISTIDKISWLAVPHFGARGGSAVLLSVKDIFPLKYVLRLLFSIPYLQQVFDRFGGMLISFGLDAQAAHDLDVRSHFISRLNSEGKVRLLGAHEYKNAVAINDQIVGSGAKIGQNIIQDNHTSFEEKEFSARHGNLPWEQSSQPYEEQEHGDSAIHHSLEVIHWIMN